MAKIVTYRVQYEDTDGPDDEPIELPATLEIPGIAAGAAAATAANYGTIFIANRGYVVTAIREVHRTAGTDAGAVTLQVEKLTGTQAKDAGVDLLSTGFNLKATVETVVDGALVAAEATRTLAAGDRLGLVTAGVLTTVADVCVTITLKAA